MLFNWKNNSGHCTLQNILRRLGNLNYEVSPDKTQLSACRHLRPEVVHIALLKAFYAQWDCGRFMFQITLQCTVLLFCFVWHQGDALFKRGVMPRAQLDK